MKIFFKRHTCTLALSNLSPTDPLNFLNGLQQPVLQFDTTLPFEHKLKNSFQFEKMMSPTANLSSRINEKCSKFDYPNNSHLFGRCIRGACIFATLNSKFILKYFSLFSKWKSVPSLVVLYIFWFYTLIWPHNEKCTFRLGRWHLYTLLKRGRECLWKKKKRKNKGCVEGVRGWKEWKKKGYTAGYSLYKLSETPG